MVLFFLCYRELKGSVGAVVVGKGCSLHSELGFDGAGFVTVQVRERDRARPESGLGEIYRETREGPPELRWSGNGCVGDMKTDNGVERKL